MSYEAEVMVDGIRRKRKVDVCPIAIYDPSVELSEAPSWQKAYAVDESGTPILFGDATLDRQFGDEEVLTQFETRKCTLKVPSKGQWVNITKDTWKIFVTNYRLVLTLPAEQAPATLFGIKPVRPRTSLLRMAAAAAVHTARAASAKKGVAGNYLVFSGFYTNLTAGMIHLDKKHENFKVEIIFRSPAQPFGQNSEFFPDGLWHIAETGIPVIERFPSVIAAKEFLNQVYDKAILTKKRFFERMKQKGRLSPATTEDTILNELNALQADPIQDQDEKLIRYWGLQPVDLLPFLPTSLSMFGVKESVEQEFRMDSSHPDWKSRFRSPSIYARK